MNSVTLSEYNVDSKGVLEQISFSYPEDNQCIGDNWASEKSRKRVKRNSFATLLYLLQDVIKEKPLNVFVSSVSIRLLNKNTQKFFDQGSYHL